MEQDFLKKQKNLRSNKRLLMFWGAIQLDARKMVVNCPNKLNAASYLEISRNYEKPHFQDINFQQDNAPVHKSKSTGNFSERGGRYWNGCHIVQI